MLSRASVALAILALLLLAATALPASAWPGAVDADSATGRALFAAKGCAGCHYHVAVAGSGKFSGGPGGPPAFTGPYTGDPAFLRSWLRDPQALRPATTMPNLHLSDAEVAALVAFLREGAPSAR